MSGFPAFEIKIKVSAISLQLHFSHTKYVKLALTLIIYNFIYKSWETEH
jgi:hypothetical protein